MKKLETIPYLKVWGTSETRPWYRNPERQKIGEVWFSASDKVPLLVKFLFTSAPLSVQVHPNDAYARLHHNSPGKTEMWHVLRADPGAKVALGLKKAVPPEHLRAACLDGAVVDLLNWIPAQPGDTFFSESGTIHAIGGGLVLCEVQQYSDITYRLFDYERSGRELHLDRGLEVANLDAVHGKRELKPLADHRDLLVECACFRTEKFRVERSAGYPCPDRSTICIALKGEGRFGEETFQPGEAFEIPAGEPGFEIETPAAEFLITGVPAS